MATKNVVVHFDILSSMSEEALRCFLSQISKVDDGRWRPERYNNHDPVSRVFDPGRLDGPVGLWQAENIGLTLKRLNPPKYELDFWGEDPKSLVKNQFYLWSESAWLKTTHGVDSFLGFMNQMYEALPPAHGYAAMQRDYEAKNRLDYAKDENTTVQKWVGRDLRQCLRGVYWANWFGPDYVNYFGAERLESAPCYRRERLADGGFLLLTARSPLDYEVAESKEAERRLRDHLGEDAFFDIASPDRVTSSPWRPRAVGSSDHVS